MPEKAITLLVTSDEAEGERLRSQMEAAGHSVHRISQFEDMERQIEECHPEVLILDAVTDPEAATRVVTAIRESERLSDLQILALVPEGDADAAVAAIEAGADDWVGWPARGQSLLTRIALLVRIRRLHEELGARVVEARALARQRDHMVSMLTHDMKSPLTVILGHLRLLEDGQLGELPGAEARSAIASSIRNAHRLIEYIDNFLALNHSLVDALEVRQEKIDLAPLLQEVAENHMPASRREGIHFEFAIEEGIGEVVGDTDHLIRAVENLITNALKFTPEGGTVTLGAQPESDGVTIWVEDTGPGISEGEIEHIFDPFHRGSGAERLARGVGLGLCVVRQVAEAHGGEVKVESSVGEGSRFTLHLPRHPGRAHRRTALIIEDNSDFARILAMSLKLEGMESTICTSAEEALDVLQSHRPDLITLDLMLPGMQGRQFLEGLHSLLGPEAAPVLALSASDRRLEGVSDIPMVRIRMPKDAFNQSAFRRAARELLQNR
ncbi:response regulator [Candidatus Sumerlaeota bacterium]|nr:response regulator [Candidatus Sumerlaeota bacterium]